MKKLLTFAKGKLTASSIIAYLITQRVDELPQAFELGLYSELNLIELATIAGAIWGVIRRNFYEYRNFKG